MKQYLILFFLLTSPLFLHADHKIDKKFSLISEAEKHKKLAAQELDNADSICYYIPNLQDRANMHALITSALSATIIPDPKAKIIAIGLSLIGSLANGMYDKYCEYRECLIRAAYHIEMFNFYVDKSLRLSKHPDKGTEAFLGAIDCLTLCDMAGWVLENDDDKWHYNATMGIYHEIVDLRGLLISELIHNEIPKYSREQVFKLYENIYEILEEKWGNERLIRTISANLKLAIVYLEQVERYWKIK